MQTCCTIISADYYPRALALYKSISRFSPALQLQVLVADSKPVSARIPANLKLFNANELVHYPLADSMYNRYAHLDMDLFRWSMKSVFISYLLENRFDKVLYLDCDMFFVNEFSFLFDELDKHSILLTPHWKTSDPLVDEQAFLSQFTSGIFSAGFIGANRQGIPALQWWAHACHYMMGPKIELGIHDDQRFLDIFPVLFAETGIVRHQGCNVGSWNFEVCKRTLVNGKVMINDKFPVIFIHFDKVLASEILKGHDPLLLPYFEEYRKLFEEEGHSLANFMDRIQYHLQAGSLVKLKWKLKVRTRLKSFLYKLAKSI